MTLARRTRPAVREAQDRAAETVPHLDSLAILRLIEEARSARQTGGAKRLLIATLYDGVQTQGLRGPESAPNGSSALRHGLDGPDSGQGASGDWSSSATGTLTAGSTRS